MKIGRVESKAIDSMESIVSESTKMALLSRVETIWYPLIMDELNTHRKSKPMLIVIEMFPNKNRCKPTTRFVCGDVNSIWCCSSVVTASVVRWLYSCVVAGQEALHHQECENHLYWVRTLMMMHDDERIGLF